MIAYTSPFVERSRKFIDSESKEDLKYAALELRFAIEEIAYQKLAMRLKKMSPKELESWQPGRVIKQLAELVDPNLKSDSTIFLGLEDENGNQPNELNELGRTIGVNYKELEKHWHKLGSYLHRRMPDIDAKGHVQMKDNIITKEYAEEVIEYIEELSSTHFDAFLSREIIFECNYCKKSIVMSQFAITDQTVVQCRNPNCGMEYIVFCKDEKFVYNPNVVFFECNSCGDKNDVNIAALKRIPLEIPVSVQCSIVCKTCKSENYLCWILMHGVPSDEGLKSLMLTCKFQQE